MLAARVRTSLVTVAALVLVVPVALVPTVLGVSDADGAPARAVRPVVTRLSVTSGPTAGGLRVRITGRHLDGARRVLFGTSPGKRLVRRSATQLVVTAPRHAAGQVDVVVVGTGDRRSAARRVDRFRYVAAPVVTGLSVSSGPSAGGTRVTVSGRNLVGVRAVEFGNVAGRAPKVTSAGSLAVTSPAHALGTVHVRVVTRYGVSSPVAVDRFRFTGWALTRLPAPADAADVPHLRDVACWGDGRCAAVGSYTDRSGNGAAVLWTLSGRTWTAVRAPLPADAASDPDPLSEGLTCGAAGLCAAYGTYDAHRNGADTHTGNLVWTLANGSWTGQNLPLPGDAAPGFVNIESLVCAGAICAGRGNYSSTGQATAVLWTRVGGSWAATKAPLPADAHADPFDDVASLACDAAGTCVAGGSYFSSSPSGGAALWRLTGSTWTVVAAPLPPDATGSPTSNPSQAACGAPGSCVVTLDVEVAPAPRQRRVLWSLGGGAWSIASLPLPSDAHAGSGYSIDRVACSTAGTCVAAGQYADAGGDIQVVLWTRTGTGSWAPSRAPLPADAAQNPQALVRGLSCAGDGTCAAVGVYNPHLNGHDVDEHGAFIRAVWRYDGSAWSLVPPFASSRQGQVVFSFACGGASCAVVDYESAGPPYWRIWKLGGGPVQAFVPTGSAGPDVQIDGVTCPPVGGCVAVGDYADANLNWVPAVWVEEDGVS